MNLAEQLNEFYKGKLNFIQEENSAKLILPDFDYIELYVNVLYDGSFLIMDKGKTLMNCCKMIDISSEFFSNLFYETIKKYKIKRQGSILYYECSKQNLLKVLTIFTEAIKKLVSTLY